MDCCHALYLLAFIRGCVSLIKPRVTAQQFESAMNALFTRGKLLLVPRVTCACKCASFRLKITRQDISCGTPARGFSRKLQTPHRMTCSRPAAKKGACVRQLRCVGARYIPSIIGPVCCGPIHGRMGAHFCCCSYGCIQTMHSSSSTTEQAVCYSPHLLLPSKLCVLSSEHSIYLNCLLRGGPHCGSITAVSMVASSSVIVSSQSCLDSSVEFSFYQHGPCNHCLSVGHVERAPSHAPNDHTCRADFCRCVGMFSLTSIPMVQQTTAAVRVIVSTDRQTDSTRSSSMIVYHNKSSYCFTTEY